MAQDPSVVFVRDGTRVPFPYASTGEFLLQAKRGAYTTARSVDQDAIFEWEAHVERMAKSSKLMMDREESESADGIGDGAARHSDITSAESLRPLLLDTVAEAMTAFKAGHEGQEMKITVLITWTSDDYEISTLVVPLGNRPAQPVKAQVGGKPRKNALAKDSEWTRQRLSLEKQKPADVNEIILMDEDGGLFEGTQTNFYAVQDGAVYTAEEGILEGTVRKMILEVCEREGVPIRREPPNIKSIGDWQGAFISSTSRLLLPLAEIDYRPAEGAALEKRVFEPCPLVDRLEGLILSEFRELSTRIIQSS